MNTFTTVIFLFFAASLSSNIASHDGSLSNSTESTPLSTVVNGSQSTTELKNMKHLLENTKSLPKNTKRLPGVSYKFKDIRKKNGVFVDKTSFISTILDDIGGRLFFMTRPGRFGKTVFLEMLDSFFRGEKKFFEGTAIYPRGNTEENNEKWLVYPIVYLDFSTLNFDKLTTKENFNILLEDLLKLIARSYGLDTTSRGFGLSSLISDLKFKFNLPAVILIDEYDRPLQYSINVLNNTELARHIEVSLECFFTELKALNSLGYSRLVFVTGILKLRIISGESEANNYIDLTYDQRFATALGFTLQEIETYFKPHIRKVAKFQGLSVQAFMNELINWYDGYLFSLKGESVKVLNPVSTINCLREESFGNYWCSTGSLHYMIRRIFRLGLKLEYFDNWTVYRSSLFWNRNIEGIPIEVYMLFTGYLTMKSIDPTGDKLTLGFPNNEIKEILYQRLFSYVPSLNKFIDELPEWLSEVRISLTANDVPRFVNRLQIFGFPKQENLISSSNTVSEEDVTRRLKILLDTAKIGHTSGSLSKSGNDPKGGIDLQTTHLPTNYIIEIKCGRGAFKGMRHLINYATNNSESFQKTIEYQSEVYLMSMNFTRDDGGKIDHWICIPLRGKTFLWEKITSSCTYLKERIVKLIKESV